jgi:glutamyl-tRNA synthetase
MPSTRLAPSPTGALHLGNARTFLVNWLLARRSNWRIILRIEDLDGPRVKPMADRQAIEDLQWLGLDWDGPPVYQSDRLDVYTPAIEALVAAGRVYPCVCTRREVEVAASAPHADDGSGIYPGTCRDRFRTVEEARAATGRDAALRFRVQAGVVEFHDEVKGPRAIDVAARLGDFVVAKAAPRGDAGAGGWTPAYQLAVVVDDAEMGVTDVVRGDDLLDSAPRQILLYRAMGMAERAPRYYHLPLVVGADGRRLAKRHGDTRLSYYRHLGVPPEQVLVLLGRWCGIEIPNASARREGLLREMLERFRLESLPPGPITFGAADDAWVRAARPD